MNCNRTPGKKSTPHRDPAEPPRRRANKRKGHGTSANDRPPISVVSRETGEQRFWVCGHADRRRTCRQLIAETVPGGEALFYTDEWPSYRGSHPCHTTVRRGMYEWARDADGLREVHGNTCEGAGAALRTYLGLQRSARTVLASVCRDLRSHDQRQAGDTDIDPTHVLRYPVSAH
jgi:hypothetical protein